VDLLCRCHRFARPKFQSARFGESRDKAKWAIKKGAVGALNENGNHSEAITDSICSLITKNFRISMGEVQTGAYSQGRVWYVLGLDTENVSF